MSHDPHYVALQNMYLAAPINEFYGPRIEITTGEATIEIDVSERLFHAAGAVHGSVCFKMLDDAAFFAANSLERKTFVLTTSFTTYFLRPVTSGVLRSTGRVVHEGRSQLIAESVVLDERGRDVGRGSGIFVRGSAPLADALGYGP